MSISVRCKIIDHDKLSIRGDAELSVCNDSATMQPYERTALRLEQLKHNTLKSAANEAVRLKAIAFVAQQLDDQIRRARANGDLV